MNKITTNLLSVAVLMFYSVFAVSESGNRNVQTQLSELVTELQKDEELVGMGAMVFHQQLLIAETVSGERKIDSGVALSLSDQWHIGSVTKSVTATMIGRLVEAGQLNWQTTVADIFTKEVKSGEIAKSWRRATLEQLLTHTSGVDGNFPSTVQSLWPKEGKERTDERRKQVLKILQQAPNNAPGTTFQYSNLGYTIAGVFAEHVTGKSWEALIRKEVFTPLKLSTAGFGPPKDGENKLSQPRGHQKGLFGFGSPKAVSTDADNTPIMGPAGTIRMSMRDLSTYANEHLLGELGKGKLVKPKTYKILHRPKLDNYAAGWVIQTTKSGHQMIWHNGSNTMWYTLVVIFPELELSVVVMANDGNISTAEPAAWKIVRAMKERMVKDQ